MLRKALSAGLIVLILGTLAVPATAAAGDGEIRVTKLIVYPSGPDLNFTVYYESSFFTRVFSLIFGAKVVQAPIEHVFVNYSRVSLASIDSNSGVAKVVAKNASKLSADGWYVYAGDTALPASVATIEVHSPDGKVMTVHDVNKVPALSNRAPVN